MDESDYWKRLEFRVCRELAGLRDNSLRGLGCDGFIPEQLQSDQGGTRVTGIAWIMRGRDQEPWRFTLIAGNRGRSWEDADWTALLPPDDVTGWLSLDLDERTLKIDLAAAYPDAEACRRHPDATTSREEFD